MKRLLSLFAFLSFLPCSFSQDYIPFPLENVRWTNGFYQLNTSDPNWYFYELAWIEVFETGEDTTINETNYTKIISDNENSLYVGALREEEGRVFFVQRDSINEEVLYDFTLDPGDTIAVYGGPFSYYPMVVQDTTQINLEGVWRKVIQFEGGNWIEGIGNDRGLFNETLYNISNYWTYQECVTISDDLVFDHEQGDYDCTLSSPELAEENLTIYPNPSRGHFTIKGIQSNAILEIRDLQGRLIQSEDINSTAQIIYLNNELNSGMYLDRIYSGSNQFTQRLLIE